MRNRYSKQEMDRLIANLLQCHSQSRQAETAPSSHFMMQVRARIHRQSSASHFWENGVIKAQNWLFAFSLIALLFFVSNLISTVNGTHSGADATADVPALSEHDWEHLNDESLPVSEVAKF